MNASDMFRTLLTSSSFHPEWIRESAWLEHLHFAAWVIEQQKPEIFVELGTHYGVSYFAFCQAVQRAGLTTKCYAVDHWKGDPHARLYGPAVYDTVEAYNTARYANFSALLRMDFGQALERFAPKSVDLIHFDGFHTYEAVKADFESWQPKLSTGAIAVFHDTRIYHNDFGVWQLWRELTACYPWNLEFKHGNGLGVVLLHRGDLPDSMNWLRPGSSEQNLMLEHFELVGRQFTQIRELRAKVPGLTSLLNREQAELTSVKNSLSWRMTKPFRVILDFARGNLSKAASSTANGLKLLLNSARRSGLTGVGKVVVAALFCRHDRTTSISYDLWIENHDKLSDSSRDKIRGTVKKWDKCPLISVVMPVYNPRIEFLEAALDSVLNQLYPHWELCIVDDCSSDPEVAKLLRKYADGEPRIKIFYSSRNAGIAETSNAAISMASGDWVALLDHDDALAEHALYMVAKTIRADQDIALIYSDEDKIEEQGHRCHPYFKPDWNMALLRSHNLITHLAVYRSDILREIGCFRKGFEGAQDYDLALRFSETVRPHQIVHIPHILYHWRIHPGSTSDASSNAKPHAMLNGERALNEHLQRSGVNGTGILIGHGYKVSYALPSPQPKASLIITTRDRADLLERCITSVCEKTIYENYEIVVVDNGSSDSHTLSLLQKFRLNHIAKVVRDDGDFNYSRLNNTGVRAATGEVVVLMNNDLEVTEGEWLREMVSLAILPDTGAVGAKLLFPDGSIQHGGVILGIGGFAGHAHKCFPGASLGYNGRLSLVSEFSAVTGACLAVRKSLYERAGGLDELNLKVACNDVDLCLRLKELGFNNLWTPHACLYHHESASRGYEDNPEKIARYKAEREFMERRWGQRMFQDPYYNPNLTLEKEDFDLAWPPRACLP
jgi:glycosyltransferase involved in cell wall biosynthesis